MQSDDPSECTGCKLGSWEQKIISEINQNVTYFELYPWSQDGRNGDEASSGSTYSSRTSLGFTVSGVLAPESACVRR